MHSWIDISSQSPFPFLKNFKSADTVAAAARFPE